MNIVLKPIPVSEQLMDELETKGIISRLRPGKSVLDVGPGKTKHRSLYESDEKYGPHKLICVTINSVETDRFLYHSDHEDFILIDLPDRSDLIITFSMLDNKRLEDKIEAGCLCRDDFMSLIFKPNDPYTSFFTMKAGFAHVETCAAISDKPPSFYVAEARDLDENVIDFKQYNLRIEV